MSSPKISFFERHLTWWVVACIAAGIALGKAAPHAVSAIARCEIAQVNLVVAGLIGFSVVFGAGSGIAASFSGNILAWGGSLAGIAAVFGLVGFFVGRASE
jgi:hypothetical protein